MAGKLPPSASEHAIPSPEDYANAGGREPPHTASITEVAAEAMRSGVVGDGVPSKEDEFPGDDARLQAGDPDVDPMENEFSGEEVPGGTTPTPDQNQVDDIGRAYGLTEEDDGELRLGEELLDKRDAHRWELDPRSRDPDPNAPSPSENGARRRPHRPH